MFAPVLFITTRAKAVLRVKGLSVRGAKPMDVDGAALCFLGGTRGPEEFFVRFHYVNVY